MMNALKPMMIRATVLAGRRMATTAAAIPKTSLDHAPKVNFKQIWLSDTATYPLIVIMTCAMTFMTGMGLNGMLNYKDVRVDKKKRTAMIRNWGSEEKKTVIQTLVQGRYEKIKADRAERRTPTVAV